MDITGDDTGVWMTYDQLAEARDIKRDGARRLAQRHRWRRQTGNDGLARVLVPPEWISTQGDSPRDVTRDAPISPGAVTPDVTGVVVALQGAIDTLRQQLVRADARADALQAERDAARTEATDAAARAAAAEQATRVAQDAAQVLRQAEAARKTRGRWARLSAAWRGE